MKRIVFYAVIIFSLGIAADGFAVDISDTKLLTQPAISKDRIAFVYANDLWSAKTDGSDVRRLTSDDGIESNPAFSPDGSLLAFSAQYDGNTDVYLMPVQGGSPTRLTWHPGADIVQGFSPDGASVLFTSGRYVFTGRYTQLFAVPVKGGFPGEPLKIPYANKGAYSPDASRLAYNPLYPAFTQWKNYRGGTNSVVQIFRFSDNSVEKVPQPAGRCNDADPMWMGDAVYFRSDRNGEFNIFAFDVKTRALKQLTSHNDFPVMSCSAGAGRIIYEQAGHLHLMDLKSGKSTKLTVGVSADLIESRPRFVKGFRYIRGVSLSPTGARVVLDFRGEIVIPFFEEFLKALFGDHLLEHFLGSLWGHDREIGFLQNGMNTQQRRGIHHHVNIRSSAV